MTLLSLNKAAEYSGKAKKTLLEHLNSKDLNKKLSGEKNDKGHWQIDTAELDRMFPKTANETGKSTVSPPLGNHDKTSSNSALAVEVKMLREQIDRMDSERERERAQLSDQINELREQMQRQSADHRQALALLADQRQPEKDRGFTLWPFGRKASAV